MYAIVAKIVAAVGIKGIIAAVGLVAIVSGVWWFISYQREIGHAAAIAQVKEESAQESERRRLVVEEALKIADAAVVRLKTVEENNATLLQQFETLSARNDAVDCLDADAVERLRRLDNEPGR